MMCEWRVKRTEKGYILTHENLREGPFTEIPVQFQPDEAKAVKAYVAAAVARRCEG